MLFSPPPEPPPSDPALVAPGLFRMTVPGVPDAVRGWLSIRRSWEWTVEGPWWRRRDVRPEVRAEFDVVWNGDFTTLDLFPGDDADHWFDGGGDELAADELAEIEQGTFTMRGVVFDLEFVDPRDDPEAWIRWWYFLPRATPAA